MKNISQDLRDYKKMGFQAFLTLTMAFSFIACSEDSGLSANTPFGSQYYNQSSGACGNQRFNAGIPGNSACPYGGQIINGELEGFAEFRVDGAIYLDFGLQYNDLCPVGEVPVYESRYGQVQLAKCEYVGNDFFDPTFISGHHNSSSCSGGYTGDRNCIPGAGSYNSGNRHDVRYDNRYDGGYNDRYNSRYDDRFNYQRGNNRLNNRPHNDSRYNYNDRYL